MPRKRKQGNLPSYFFSGHQNAMRKSNEKNYMSKTT